MLGNVQKSLDGNKSVFRQVTLILYDTLDPPFHASKHVQTIHQGGTQDPKPEEQSNALTDYPDYPPKPQSGTARSFFGAGSGEPEKATTRESPTHKKHQILKDLKAEADTQPLRIGMITAPGPGPRTR